MLVSGVYWPCASGVHCLTYEAFLPDLCVCCCAQYGIPLVLYLCDCLWSHAANWIVELIMVKNNSLLSHRLLRTGQLRTVKRQEQGKKCRVGFFSCQKWFKRQNGIV